MKTVIALIKKQNLLLNQCMSVLENQGINSAHKQKQMIFFIDLLITCIKAEENSLLDILQRNETCQDLAFDVIEGNAIARILVSDLQELDYKNKWDQDVVAKLKILMRLIHNNAREKEDLLMKADLVLSRQQQIFLGKKFQRNLI